MPVIRNPLPEGETPEILGGEGALENLSQGKASIGDLLSILALAFGGVKDIPETAKVGEYLFNKMNVGDLGRFFASIGKSPNVPEMIMEARPSRIPDVLYVESLAGMFPKSLKESKATAEALKSILKSANVKGVEFYPLDELEHSGKTRTRLFEYLLGKKAIPPSETKLNYRIPLND